MAEATLRIGIMGKEPAGGRARGCGLWPPGYAAAIETAGGTPALLGKPRGKSTWEDVLEGVKGLVFTGPSNAPEPGKPDPLVETCRELCIPLLCVDEGLLALNESFGGSVYRDLARELPTAMQHQYRPEPGLRHAIDVQTGTRVASYYGEGEIVVNSEHRHAVNQVGKGFLVSARALDGVVEAIEYETDRWYCIGVQWHPASASASGLDIQLFRGLVEASQERHAELTAPPVTPAAA
jgi:putative glutamine amidotransferase